MLPSQKILIIKKYFFIFGLFIFAYFLSPVKIFALTNYFPVVTDSKSSFGLKLISNFDLDRDQVNLKISTKTKNIKLEAISLKIDNNNSVSLTPASSTNFWLDLNSGDHLLSVSVIDQNGYVEQATSTVFVPHLQAPFIDLFPLTIYQNKTFVLGGQTIYPSKQLAIHLNSGSGEKIFLVEIDPSGRFNWSGKISDHGNIEIWAEVLDGSLRSLPSNPIKIKTDKVFSYQWFIDLHQSISSYTVLNLTIGLLLLIALVTLLLNLFKRDKKIEKELLEKKLLSSADSLRQDILEHLDIMSEVKDLSKEFSLPILLDLQRTVEIVHKYLQTQIITLTKNKGRTKVGARGPKKKAVKK